MDQIISWLMEGDPAIRWQVMHDLQDKSARVWKAEQQRVFETGWGKQFLDRQDADSRWGNGIYSPKWISTTYTLLTLIGLGILNDCEAAQRGARLAVDTILGETLNADFQKRLTACDRCIVGMMLQIGVYFEIKDERIDAIVDNLLNEIMPDGGWNCRRGGYSQPHHSSFNTTFNVLEGLREYIESHRGPRRKKAIAAEHNALKLLLQHRLLKSDKTGNIINSKFKVMSYPPRWHYDFLRGLVYFARADAPRDKRLQDAIDLLISYRREDGTWPIQYQYRAKEFFVMERVGKPSRWNTLRALQVLRWWNS
jgi:hypothetical protein